jgi:uncharacterized protein
VLDVDLERKRIALSMRLQDEPEPRAPRGEKGQRQKPAPKRETQRGTTPRQPAPGGAMAAAFAKARKPRSQ